MSELIAGNEISGELENIAELSCSVHLTEKGPQGPKGDDGYSPARGVDYMTAEDIQTMHDYIDAKVVECIGEVSNPQGITFEAVNANGFPTVVNCRGLQDGYENTQYLFYLAGLWSSVEVVKGFENITEIGTQAFRVKNKIREFHTSEKLKKIDNYAFYGCDGLTDDGIVLSGLEFVGVGTFENCYGFVNLSLPHIKTISERSFKKNTGLKTVVLGSSGNPIDINDVNRVAFDLCVGIETLSLYVSRETLPETKTDYKYGASNAVVKYIDDITGEEIPYAIIDDKTINFSI